MKIEEYECVKIKRRARERIHAETQGMTPEQLMTYYNKIGDVMRKRQTEPSAKWDSEGA